MQTISRVAFTQQLQEELTSNILPFWMTHMVDRENGGFYGALSNDLQIFNDVPRSSILCTRILWTYSQAYRIFGDAQYLTMAKWAYDYLTQVFWDQEYGGVYWDVDATGKPLLARKHHYAQAFCLYGLAEYYRATQVPQSLVLAQKLFCLLEEHAFDPVHSGYIEGSSREWQPVEDMRLSTKELNCRKSMNTMLHLLEAYTNLLRVWDDDHIRRQHKALLKAFHGHVVDHQSGHFKLFFDDQWQSLSNIVSYGHDIEGSWLIWEAAEVQGDPDLMAEVRGTAVQMATAVYNEALDHDGSLFYESEHGELIDDNKAWWPQAEAMVGFYNAYQLSGQTHFAQAALRCWGYIQTRLVDKTHGDWYKQLNREGIPDHSHYKAGPWDCPYHHSRACFEMMARLKEA
jgi:mannobiose 2-epimerase